MLQGIDVEEYKRLNNNNFLFINIGPTDVGLAAGKQQDESKGKNGKRINTQAHVPVV